MSAKLESALVINSHIPGDADSIGVGDRAGGAHHDVGRSEACDGCAAAIGDVKFCLERTVRPVGRVQAEHGREMVLKQPAGQEQATPLSTEHVVPVNLLIDRADDPHRIVALGVAFQHSGNFHRLCARKLNAMSPTVAALCESNLKIRARDDDFFVA